MNRIRLDYWSPVTIPPAPEQANADPHVVIVGTCYNHPLKEDGAEVSTGKITAVKVVPDGEEGRAILAVTVLGTEYELCDPSRKYDQVFPNAREKIFEWWDKNHPLVDQPKPEPTVAYEPELEKLAA